MENYIFVRIFKKKKKICYKKKKNTHVYLKRLNLKCGEFFFFLTNKKNIFNIQISMKKQK